MKTAKKTCAKTIGPALSEDLILERLPFYFQTVHKRVALGRGDDCAILKEGRQLCVSSDLFMEDTHFRLSYFEPAEIGFKSLAVNLSDLAAMGARPIGFTLDLGLPKWIDLSWLDQFFAGMGRLAEKQRMSLLGGDLSRADKLHISITIFGETADNCSLLRRGECMAGDYIFIVGHLGLSRVGLKVLEEQGREALKLWPNACAAHLTPTPQMDAALMLARAGYNARPPALMDVSDGIARDLPRLIGRQGSPAHSSSQAGAHFSFPPGLLHPELLLYCRNNGLDPVNEALLGGEDYALLGACAPDMMQALHTAIPDFHCLGKVTSDGKIICNGKDITELTGFDHFEN